MTQSTLRRFFYTSADLSTPLQSLDIGSQLPLTNSIFHHWCRVLRASVDDLGILFDGYGAETTVKLTDINKKNATVTIVSQHNVSRQSDLNITVAMVMSRGDRTDYAIQKMTELGVTHIQLLKSQYGEVNLKTSQVEKKLTHWQQVALSACEQCGLNTPPLIHAPLKLSEWLSGKDDNNCVTEGYVTDSVKALASLPYYQFNYIPSDSTLKLPIKLILTAPRHSEADSVDVYKHLIEQIQSFNMLNLANNYVTQRLPIEVLIGPEGGFSDIEQAQATQLEFMPWQLGSRILRAETAPVVALSALQTINHLSK